MLPRRIPQTQVDQRSHLFLKADDLGHPLADLPLRTRNLVRRFYELKCGARMELACLDGKPLTVVQFMRSLKKILKSQRLENPGNDHRVSFECSTEQEHFIPITYVRHKGKEYLYVVDSIDMAQPEKMAISKASARSPAVEIHLVESGGMASHGCLEQTLVMGKKLTEKSQQPGREHSYRIAADGLFSLSQASDFVKGAQAAFPPDSLLFYAERPGFLEDYQDNTETVHSLKRDDGLHRDERLSDYLARHTNPVSGRIEYLRHKGHTLALYAEVMDHLDGIERQTQIELPSEAKAAFLLEAKAILRQTRRSQPGDPRHEEENLQAQSEALQAWLTSPQAMACLGVGFS